MLASVCVPVWGLHLSGASLVISSNVLSSLASLVFARAGLRPALLNHMLACGRGPAWGLYMSGASVVT